MLIIDSYPQGDPRWFQERLGNPGASNFHKICTSKGLPSKSRDGYMKDLAGEIITGRPASSFSSWKMDQGLENEAEACAYYEMVHDVDMIQVALCYPDEQKMYHCSPDRLMPALKKGFETKDCSETPRLQIERLQKGTVDSKYWTQCQGSLLVTGYDSWIYQSYCRRMRALTIEVFPDWKFMAQLKKELESFCLELAILVKKIRGS